MWIYIHFFLLIISFIGCGTPTNSISTITETSNQVHNTQTIYEDAEDGSNQKWEVWEGPYDVEVVNFGANNSKHAIFLRENWHKVDGKFISGVYYRLTNKEHTLWDNSTQKVLHFDHMKQRSADGRLYCFTVSVEIDTTFGRRMISFNTFYDKQHYDAESIDSSDTDYEKELVFPLTMSYVNNTNKWRHLSFNIEDYLHRLEPDNDLVAINAFVFNGGDDYLDNIALASE